MIDLLLVFGCGLVLIVCGGYWTIKTSKCKRSKTSKKLKATVVGHENVTFRGRPICSPVVDFEYEGVLFRLPA